EPRVLRPAPLNGGVVNTQLGNPLIGTTFDTDKAKIRFPDIVQNWRVDQAWGSAQLMVAAHDVSGGYFANGLAGTAVVNNCLAVGGGILPNAVRTITGSGNCGHPAGQVGWAAGGRAQFQLPSRHS